jgi:hypothetical protein
MKALSLVVSALLIFNIANSQSIDTAAYARVDNALKILKTKINSKSIDIKVNSNLITFFSHLTGIPSDSDGNYMGQYHPSERDYILWKNWLVSNRYNIKYNKDSNMIYLKVKVVLPSFKE